MTVFLEMADEASLEHGLSCLLANSWMPQLVDIKDLHLSWEALRF